MQADLGQELVEAWIGTERVGHRFYLQVDETVDALLVCCGEKVKGLIFVPQADVNGGWINIGDEPGLLHLGELIQCVGRFHRVSR